MFRPSHLLPLLLAAALAGCGTGVAAPPPTVASLAHLDAGSSGGLADDLAAHPSVQLAHPTAFTLTTEARPFLAALEAIVVPQRVAIAGRLAADTTVKAGIQGWTRAGQSARLATLAQVATITSEVMGCHTPSLAFQDRDAASPTLLASYTPGAGMAGVGMVGAGMAGAVGGGNVPPASIVLYTQPLAAGGATAAIGALVHELRHAAQDELSRTLPAASDTSSAAVLARAYLASFDAIGRLGGETDLAYGDYVHLNVEYDAFQTGNEVVARLASGLAGQQPGFVDVQYGRDLRPLFDLPGAAASMSGVALIQAVNASQAAARQTLVPSAGRERLRGGGRGRG